MVDLREVQEELNMKLCQGFRTVFFIIAKEVNHASRKLVKTVESKKLDDSIRYICEGASVEELSRLINALNVAAETLNAIYKSLNKEFDIRFPDVDIAKCISDRNEKRKSDPLSSIDEKILERFHKGEFIVDEMLSDYANCIEREIENKTRDQLYKIQRDETEHGTFNE